MIDTSVLDVVPSGGFKVHSQKYKYGGGGGKNKWWVIRFQADEKGGHLNIGPVYNIGQVETGHSSRTSLIQETEGENLPRKCDLDPFVML